MVIHRHSKISWNKTFLTNCSYKFANTSFPKCLNATINNYIGTIHKNHPANLANICKDCHLEFTNNKTIHRKTKTTDGYKLVEQ